MAFSRQEVTNNQLMDQPNSVLGRKFITSLQKQVIFPAAAEAVKDYGSLQLWVKGHLEEEMETHSMLLAWRIPWAGEKGMATDSSILAWEIPWTESLMGYSLWDPRVGHD